MVKSKIFALLTLALLGATTISAQSLVFWTNSSEQSIKSITSGNTLADTIETNQVNVRRLRIHNSDQQIYWTVGGDRKIRKSNFDGSNVEDVLSVSSSIATLDIDEDNALLYFTETGSGTIKRVNKDGTNDTIIVTGTGTILGLGVDPSNGYLFWTETDTRLLKRSDLNGTNLDTILISNNALFDLVLDPPNQHIYFSNRTTNEIQRINYDGSNLVNIVTVIGTVGTLGVDLKNRKIIWAETGPNIGNIEMANLDGTNIMTIYVDPVNTVGGTDIYVDPSVAIEEDVTNLLNIILSPNPCADILHISHDSKTALDLHIFDITGRSLKTAYLPLHEGWIDISTLPAGMLYIAIKADGKYISSQKVVKY